MRSRLFGRFETLNSCHGVFASFEEATRAAPPSKPLGYDAANSNNWYIGKLNTLSLEDYPVVFWLKEAFETGRSLFELGGHIGEAYYSFSRVIPYPADLSWTICDVPTIVKAGRALAEERGALNVEFVTDASQTAGADIYLACGALQYLDSPTPATTIAGFKIQPRHVIINTTPVYDGPSFVTLQNIGSAYCPYRIFSREELISTLGALGYDLVDSWQKERLFRIPRHPEKSFNHYSGFYFRKKLEQ